MKKEYKGFKVGDRVLVKKKADGMNVSWWITMPCYMYVRKIIPITWDPSLGDCYMWLSHEPYSEILGLAFYPDAGDIEHISGQMPLPLSWARSSAARGRWR